MRHNFIVNSVVKKHHGKQNGRNIWRQSKQDSRVIVYSVINKQGNSFVYNNISILFMTKYLRIIHNITLSWRELIYLCSPSLLLFLHCSHSPWIPLWQGFTCFFRSVSHDAAYSHFWQLYPIISWKELIWCYRLFSIGYISEISTDILKLNLPMVLHEQNNMSLKLLFYICFFNALLTKILFKMEQDIIVWNSIIN